MTRSYCCRCELLATAVLAAIGRRVKLIADRRIAELRSDAAGVSEFDQLIAVAARERDDAFARYLEHYQGVPHTAAPEAVPTGLAQLSELA